MPAWVNRGRCLLTRACGKQQLLLYPAFLFSKLKHHFHCFLLTEMWFHLDEGKSCREFAVSGRARWTAVPGGSGLGALGACGPLAPGPTLGGPAGDLAPRSCSQVWTLQPPYPAPHLPPSGGDSILQALQLPLCTLSRTETPGTQARRRSQSCLRTGPCGDLLSPEGT